MGIIALTRAKVAQYFGFFNKVCRQSSIYWQSCLCLKNQLKIFWLRPAKHLSERSVDNTSVRKKIKIFFMKKIFFVKKYFVRKKIFAKKNILEKKNFPQKFPKKKKKKKKK